MMERGEFRDDLYYRLSTMTVEIPPLRQRQGDIELLARHFLAAMDRSDLAIGSQARDLLKAYAWPGNVRELKNVIERAVSLADQAEIGPEQLPSELRSADPATGEASALPGGPLADQMAAHEKAVLGQALAANQGNMSQTAKLLGISRSTLYEKCHKHGIVTS